MWTSFTACALNPLDQFFLFTVENKFVREIIKSMLYEHSVSISTSTTTRVNELRFYRTHSCSSSSISSSQWLLF